MTANWCQSQVSTASSKIRPGSFALVELRGLEPRRRLPLGGDAPQSLTHRESPDSAGLRSRSSCSATVTFWASSASSARDEHSPVVGVRLTRAHDHVLGYGTMERFPGAEALPCSDRRGAGRALRHRSRPGWRSEAAQIQVWIGLRGRGCGAVGSGQGQLFRGTVHPGSPRCHLAAGIGAAR